MECHGGIRSVKIELNVVKPDLENDSQAAECATIIEEYLDYERKDSGRHRSHLTRF